MAEIDYVMGATERERTRLQYQASLMEPDTRRLFVQAGMGPGQRVLDLGSGAGDVAILAADLVGPTGEVIGVDRDPAQVEFANTRAKRLGLSNLRFEVGDIAAITHTTPFDAVVGRMILIHTPNQSETLARLAALVRPGGVMAFHELQIASPWRPRSWPRDAVPDSLDLAGDRMMQTVVRATGASDLVVRLPAMLSAFGQARGDLAIRVAVGREPARAILHYIADSIRSVLPASEALGLTRPGEIDPDQIHRDIDISLDRPEMEHACCEGSPDALAWVRLPG